MNVAAMATGSIGIGCAVTNLRTRHPTVTANATTALDELSDGRALLGLGAGWVAVHSIGEKPNRIAELRDGIELFRRLFSRRGDRYRRRQGAARHRTPADPDLSRRLAAPHAGACRRALRRRHPDGSGRPGLLQLADRIHPPGSSKGRAQARGHPHRSHRDHEHRRGWRPGDRRRPRLGDQPGRDLRGLEDDATGVGALSTRVQGRRGRLPLRGAPVAARRAQGDRERGVRAFGDDIRRSGSLRLPAARALVGRYRSHQLRPALPEAACVAWKSSGRT